MRVYSLLLLVFLFFLGSSSYSQNQVTWHKINNFSLETSTNTLTKTSSIGWNTAALSTNKLAANTDGSFTYVITGNEKYTTIGLNEYNNSLEHAGVNRIYINNYGSNNIVACYDVNTLVGSDNNASIGDEIKLERSGSQMIYSILKTNGSQVVLATRNTDPTKELYVDLASFYNGTVVSNVNCTFSEGLTIEAKALHHQNITENTLGSIDVNVTGEAPLSYSWSNGATTQDLTGLTAGTYILTVTDGQGATINETFEIEADTYHQVKWHHLNNYALDASTNVLDKTSYIGWNAYAISTNKLPSNTDGKYTYTITGDEEQTMIGLGEYNNSNSAGATRIYIINSGSTNNIICYNNNTTAGAYYGTELGDELILERKGNEVIYRIHKVNGVQNIIAKVATDPVKELYVNVTSYDVTSMVDNMYCTFSEGLTIEGKALHHQNITENTLGSIDVNVTGEAPLSYSWSNGATTQDLTGLTAGTYTLTVTDGQGATINETFEVEADTYHQVKWHHLNNYALDASTNVLDKTSSIGWNAYAISTNKLPSNTDGKYTYTITGDEDRTLIGLGEYNNSNSAGATRIYIINSGTANNIVCYNNNTIAGAHYGSELGDELILERKGNEVIYRIHKVNGVQNIIAKVATDPVKELYINVTSYDVTSMVDNMYCTFSEGLTIEGKALHHQNITENTLGSIDVNVTGEAPLSYSWSNGATTQDLTGLTAGTYTLTVTDGQGATINETFEIEADTYHQVKWHHLNNYALDASTNVLDKTSYVGWNAYAISTNKLPSNTDGKYKYTITGDEERTLIGLGEYNNSNSAGATRIYIINSGTANNIVCYNNNTTAGAYYGTELGDELILERKGNEVIYRIHKVNGVQNIIAKVATDPVKELYINVTSYDVTSMVDNMYCTFSEGLTIEGKALHHQNITENTLGSIDVNVTGEAPLSYSWSNGATTQDLTGLTAGTYTLTVTDGQGATINETFEIEADTYYRVKWQHINNYALDASTNVLDKTSSIGWNAYAISTNKLAANTDGKYTYTITGDEERTMIGLGEYNNSNSAGATRIYIINTGSTNNIICYNNNTIAGAHYGSELGDELILERKGNEVIYRIHKVNGVQNIIAKVATDPVKELYVNVTSYDPTSMVDNMYCTFGIENEKCGPTITLSQDSICPGDYTELTVNTLPNNDYDDYLFTWSPSNTISTTTTPLTYVANPTATTSYTLQYHFYNASDEVICSGTIAKEVTIDNKGCNEEEIDEDQEILGCCFGNFGAGVYVGNQTNLNVYCNVLNELGNESTGSVVQGEFLNKGGINVELDWIHNAQNELYVSDEGNTTLIGNDQQLRGTSETHFYNLELEGTGTTKEMLIDQYVKNVLQLNDNELATIDDVVFVENTDESAVLRGTGYVSTNGTGALSRALSSNAQVYLFPMGSQQGVYRYRPVVVEESVNQNVQVNFQNTTLPSTLSANHKAPNVQSLNQDYYYKITSDQLNANLELTLYYPTAEGPYQSIAQWRTPVSGGQNRWEMTPNPSAASLPSTATNTLGLLSATTIGVQDYITENFTLSRAGFYVNTGDLNGGDDESLVVTVTNANDANGNGIDDDQETNASGSDADGDGIDDAFDVDNTSGTDTDGDGIDDTFDANPNGGSSTGGGLNDPNYSTDDDQAFAPSPIAGTYNMNITSNDDCVEEGTVQFTVDNNGNIVNESDVKFIPAGESQAYYLSNSVFETDNVASGLILNATPEQFLEACVNNLQVKMGANEPFILNMQVATPNNQIIETIEITTPVANLLNNANFKIYRVENPANTLVYNQSPLVGNIVTLPADAWIQDGVYQFELELSYNGATETIKGQFIIKE